MCFLQAFKKYEVQAGNLESQKQTEKKTRAKTDKAEGRYK